MTTDTNKLLQECLAGLDAGLTPEECLSAYPRDRERLEPMLRQAMLLRVAFAASARPEFKHRAREALMFAAGREARQALAADPDPNFVLSTRRRLLNVAGASAQEALRNVPPPRLAFWVNARRRLLEAAAIRSAPQPAPRGLTLAFRTAYSAAAVLVIAVAVAGFAFFSNQAGGSPGVSAEFATIEQRLREVELQREAGAPVPTTTLAELVQMTLAAVGKLDTEQAPPQLSAKAEELIGRQKALVTVAASDSPGAPIALQQAQQQLQKAEEQVRVLAARVDTPQVQPTQATSLAAPPTTAPQTPASASSPAAAVATATPQPASPTPVALGPDDIRLLAHPADTAFGLTWSLVLTERMSVSIPSTWSLQGVSLDAAGNGKLTSARVFILSEDRLLSIAISLRTGEVIGLLNNNQIALRTETGEQLTVADLVVRAPGYARELSHMLETFDFESLPTPTPSVTPAATSTGTASPPRPTATP